MISNNFQFSTQRTRILMGFILYYLVLIVNPMGRILVRWKSCKKNLEILCHPVCNRLYIHIKYRLCLTYLACDACIRQRCVWGGCRGWVTYFVYDAHMRCTSLLQNMVSFIGLFCKRDLCMMHWYTWCVIHTHEIQTLSDLASSILLYIYIPTN